MIAGVDIGRSRDFTAIVTLDDLVITRADRLRLGQEWRAIVEGILHTTAGCSHIVVDATGVGSPIVEALQEKSSARVFPFLFTAASKPKLIGFLVSWFRDLSIHPACDAEDLREELSRFSAQPTRKGWKFSGKGRGGKDDLVMALALSLMARELRLRTLARARSVESIGH